MYIDVELYLINLLMCVFLSLCFFKRPLITICNTVYFFVDATASVKLDNKYLLTKKKKKSTVGTTGTLALEKRNMLL